MRTRSLCSVPLCGRSMEGLGLCAAHWSRARRGGGLRPELPIGTSVVHPLKGECATCGFPGLRPAGHAEWCARIQDVLREEFNIVDARIEAARDKQTA